MKKFTRNKDTISGNLNDEIIMMDINQGKYFALNPVATRIWELLENKMSLEELCDALQKEYEVSRDQCLMDVKEHLAELEKRKLIKSVED
jgi:hypothetical protein